MEDAPERESQCHARRQPDGPESDAYIHLRRRLQGACPTFRHPSEEPARDLQFAQTFRLWGNGREIYTQRREKNITSSDILGMLMQARDREGPPSHGGSPVDQRDYDPRWSPDTKPPPVH